MIEISRNNDTWECWIGGRLFDWNDDLELLLRKLGSQSEEIKEELKD